MFTGVFRHDLYTIAFPHGRLYSIELQALGCATAIWAGTLLGSLPCIVLRALEQVKIAHKYTLPLLRLTAYEEQTGEIGSEVAEPDIADAVDRIRVGPNLKHEKDQGWIAAVRVLAQFSKSNEQTNSLKVGLNELLHTSYRGRPEEQTALAAIAARVLVEELPMCVQRARAHWAPERYPHLRAKRWVELDSLYAETLVVCVSELAESFAGKYDARARCSPELAMSFRDAFYLLEEIEKRRKPGLGWWQAAQTHLAHLGKLSMTGQILNSAPMAAGQT
jgi:hypothetical protein